MTRIAPNDPALAHALVRGRVASDDERSQRVAGKLLQARTVKAFTEALRGFGDRLLHTEVTRASGSRAKASAVILDVAVSGIGYGIGLISFDARKDPCVSSRTARCMFSHHAVARLFQRTLNAADMHEAGHILAAHAMALDYYLDSRWFRVDGEIVSAGRGGALLGAVEAGRVVFRTWVDGNSAADPRLRQLSAGDEITVRFVPD